MKTELSLSNIKEIKEEKDWKVNESILD